MRFWGGSWRVGAILVREPSPHANNYTSEANVDSMWTRPEPSPHANHHRIEAHVDPMWTRCGPVVDRVHMRITILVTQMWTRPPFGLYNIIKDVSGESTWTSMQHVLGPRGSKWGCSRAGFCNTRVCWSQRRRFLVLLGPTEFSTNNTPVTGQTLDYFN